MPCNFAVYAFFVTIYDFYFFRQKAYAKIKSMKAVDFTNGWSYRHLDSNEEWKNVRLPHDAMLCEKRSEASAGGINTGWFEGYDYEYRAELFLDSDIAEQFYVLEFEGVYHNAEVYINGKKVYYRPYGYTNFYVPLENVSEGKNEVRVVARNADQPNSRWYSGAGIYRPVKLWRGPKSHIALNGLKITTLEIENPKITVEVETQNCADNTPVFIEIKDGDVLVQKTNGFIIGQKYSAQIELPKCELWSQKNPKLYRCIATVQNDAFCDSLEENFGIRKIEWGKNGLLLNGERVILRGACIHHDNGILGAACIPEAVERKVKLLSQNGYNAIRSAHNPCSKTLLSICDKMGILVMDEYIDHWYIHKTEHDYVDYFATWWKEDLRDMVQKDYNHPCVILYSTGNEVSETAQERGIALTQELTDFLHSLDKTRPVTCGVNIFFNFLSSIGFGVYSDKKAQKEAAAAEKRKANGSKAKKKRAVGSQFFNDLAGLFGANFMKTGATLHGCDVKTRGAFAAMDIAGYNYGIKRYNHDLKKYPDRLILGSETFCSDAYQFWEKAKTEKRLIGDFVWAGFDYLGEVGVGAWEYSEYAPEFEHGSGWLTAGSGRIDLTGKALAEATYTKIAFETQTDAAIAVIPPNHYGKKHSPSSWKMTDAMESWSFEGCEGKKTCVEVYARASFAELFVNGKSVGKKSFKNDCRQKFIVTYESGTLEAVLFDSNGKETGRKKLETAKGETCLTIEPEEKSVKKDGVTFVRFKYTGKDGIVRPLERGTLTLNVKGCELLGFGNACSYNARGYCTNQTDTYYGEALAAIRVTDSSATLNVTDGTLNAIATICSND